MKKTATLACLLACLCLPGCAVYQNVGILSEPEGAQIFLDGEVIGVTPARLRIPRTTDHSVYLKKEGFKPKLVVLTFHSMDDGIHFLTPADVGARLSPLADTLDRDLDVEIEE
ncbi:MAG: PEGA domain-containing protein [bacterium]|nr:PEGA domain-containing protein [bacterium]